MGENEIINYLLRLSDAKLVLMKDLLKLTKEQGNILETEKDEILDKLIQQKQTIIDKIDLLDREFVEKYSLLKKELGIESLQELKGQRMLDLQELKKKVHEIVEVVETIRPLDQENTEKIKKNIAKAKHNLKTIKTGRKAVTGYNNPFMETSSIFIDKKK